VVDGAAADAAMHGAGDGMGLLGLDHGDRLQERKWVDEDRPGDRRSLRRRAGQDGASSLSPD